MEGRKVRSFNVALEHIETLDGLAAALKNGNVQKFNQVAQVLAEQTGRPAPTDFNAAKQIVADETIAALVAGGGALADREEAARVWSNLKSPDQLAGVSKVMVDSKSGSNMLYLPLDKLVQQGSSGSVTVSAPQPTTLPDPQTVPGANDLRSRDNQRSRDGR